VVAAGVFEGRLPGSDVPIYFIAERNLFGRAKVYGYDDDPYRFAYFSRAALNLTEALEWRPHVVHAHDWHTAPAVTWLSTAGQGFDHFRGVPSVFTIHNLAFQGNFDRKVRHALDIDSLAFHMDGLEFHGHLSFMKSGIYYSDQITTVSPTYAKQITEPSHGCGMDGLLRRNGSRLTGILNGIDREEWNPETDQALRARYSAEDPAGKQTCKQDMCEWMELDGEGPVIGMLGRMTAQKGWDLFLDAAPRLIEHGARVAMIGEGNRDYEARIEALSSRYPGRVVVPQEHTMAFLAYTVRQSRIPLLGAGRWLACGLRTCRLLQSLPRAPLLANAPPWGGPTEA
jgi:starch synthase